MTQFDRFKVCATNSFRYHNPTTNLTASTVERKNNKRKQFTVTKTSARKLHGRGNTTLLNKMTYYFLSRFKYTNPDDYSYAPSGLMVQFINFTFRADFMTVFLSFILLFYLCVLFFACLLKLAGIIRAECIVSGIDDDEGTTSFAEGFALSWTTFTTKTGLIIPLYILCSRIVWALNKLLSHAYILISFFKQRAQSNLERECRNMFEINLERTIDAPKSKVWQTIIDCEAYPDWNPFVINCKSTFEIGSPIVMEVAVIRCLPMKQKETIRQNIEFELLEYCIHIPLLLHSSRSHILKESSGDKTFYESKFQLTGLLSTLVGLLLGKQLIRGFTEMTNALVQRCEGETKKVVNTSGNDRQTKKGHTSKRD